MAFDRNGWLFSSPYHMRIILINIHFATNFTSQPTRSPLGPPQHSQAIF